MMRLKAKVLIFWNTIVLIPIFLYIMFWILLMTVLVLSGEASNLILLLFFVMVFLLLYSILSAVRLKLDILKNVGDNFLKPIKNIYWGATVVNLGGYLVFYPLIMTLFVGGGSSVAGFFILLAIILAWPLFNKIRMIKAKYIALKRNMKVGKFWCPDCHMSLFWTEKSQDWMCYKCRAKEKYDGRFPFLHEWF